MVDQEDVYLKINVNYKGEIKEFVTTELPTLDELKNKIMDLYEIPNTKNYLDLSYKDNEGQSNNLKDTEDILDIASKIAKEGNFDIVEFKGAERYNYNSFSN